MDLLGAPELEGLRHQDSTLPNRIRGSITVYSTSSPRFTTITKMAVSSTRAWTTGMSLVKTESTSNVPRPGRPKVTSISTAPPNSPTMISPAAVTTGISEFLSTYRPMMRRRGQPARPGEGDVILLELLDHRRPGDFDDQRHQSQSQGDGGKGQVIGTVHKPLTRPEHREPIEDDAEHVQEKQSHGKGGGAHPEHRNPDHGAVGRRSPPQRRPHAERDPDDQGEQRRIEAEEDGEPDPAPDGGGHRLARLDRSADVAGHDRLEPQEVLEEERLVEIPLIADGSDRLWRGLSGAQQRPLGGPRGDVNQGKDGEADDDQQRHREQKASRDIASDALLAHQRPPAEVSHRSQVASLKQGEHRALASCVL